MPPPVQWSQIRLRASDGTESVAFAETGFKPAAVSAIVLYDRRGTRSRWRVMSSHDDPECSFEVESIPMITTETVVLRVYEEIPPR